MVGESFGREGELQRLLRKEQDLVNTNSNPGTDAVFSALPFLRFLPLQSSRNFAEVMRTHQEVLDKLDSLLVRSLVYLRCLQEKVCQKNEMK